MSFEKFTDIKRKYEDKITITGSKSFGFPAKFLEKNNITDNLKYVVLFFDPDTRRVGLQFTADENEKFKLKLFRGGQGQGASVVATSFFGKWSIDTMEVKAKYDYEVETTEEFGTMFVIRLPDQNKVGITDSSEVQQPI